jgi:hypothetical protein
MSSELQELTQALRAQTEAIQKLVEVTSQLALMTTECLDLLVNDSEQDESQHYLNGGALSDN